MPATPRKAKSPAPVDQGDVVYVNHPQHGPMALEVAAVGRDGFTGRDGDRTLHRIPHDRYLGHRTRMLHKYKVVDQGADGAILQRSDGKRRYLQGEIPRPPDAHPSEDSGGSTSIGHDDDPLLAGLEGLEKAFGAIRIPRWHGLPTLFRGLMLKAEGPIANRPGLAQRAITDRTGRTAKRWVRTNKDEKHPREKKMPDEDTPEKKGGQSEGGDDAPLHKHGDTIAFRHGDTEGQGKVVASGKDGVTVVDGNGQTQQVRHDAILPEHPLPESHETMFNMDRAHATVGMDELESSKTDMENEKGGRNAPKFMMAAHEGRGAKRDPITVRKTPEGKYRIEDGNGTYTAAKKAGWKRMPITDLDQPPAGQADTPAAEVKPLFQAEQVQDLPAKAAQPVKTKEELYAKATEAQQQLQEWLNQGKGVASSLGYTTMKGSPDEADMSKPGGMLFIAPLKGEKRATEKVEQDYGGDWSQLLDPVRASIAVDSYGELDRTLAALHASGMKLARQPKDRFSKPLPVGYRDALLNMTLPNGLIGELQLHVKPMLAAKSEGHKHYETERTLQSKKESGLSDTETATLQAAIEAQKQIYDAAWQAASGGQKGSGDSMAKAFGGKMAEFSYFEHENARYRRRNVPPFRAVDDVLHGDSWVPYKGDRLAPGLFGDQIEDPLGGDDAKVEGEDGAMRKASGTVLVFKDRT